jgi:hypothetical protein
MASTAKWTFMIYLAGDNNLSPAADVDLREMRTVGSTPEVNIVTQVDRYGTQGTTRYRIEVDGTEETTETLGVQDSGDPETLVGFIKWAAHKYPAEYYALILWNHGSGWEPSEMDRVAKKVGAENYTGREVVERSSTPLRRALFRTTLEKIFELPSPADRAIASDDGSGHSLDTVELGRVLDTAVKTIGQPFELLGMDACLMSNFEVAYQVSPYARYMVASEENEPNNGWPYDEVLREVVDDANAPTQRLAAHVVRAYIDWYARQGYSGPVTQSACDLSKVKGVAEALDKLADALSASLQTVAMDMWRAQRTSARFWHNTLWDIAHFCEELEKTTTDNRVKEAARETQAALRPGEGNFIIAEAHNGQSVQRCGGSSIYLLPPPQEMSRYYDELEFARKHRWLSLLKQYHTL